MIFLKVVVYRREKIIPYSAHSLFSALIARSIREPAAGYIAHAMSS
jgi:hypothetical protein